jgi:hypothetical protein
MRSCAARDQNRGVEETSISEVVLHLTVGADPIAGMVTVDRGRRCSFCGWLELMTVIDDASGRSPTVPQEPACERQYDNYRRRR